MSNVIGAQAKNRTLNTVVPRQWYTIYLQEQNRMQCLRPGLEPTTHPQAGRPPSMVGVSCLLKSS